MSRELELFIWHSWNDFWEGTLLINLKIYSIMTFFFTLLNIMFPGDLSPAELMMLTIGDVIKQLIEAHEQGKDIDLNK